MKAYCLMMSSRTLICAGAVATNPVTAPIFLSILIGAASSRSEVCLVITVSSGPRRPRESRWHALLA